MGDLDRVSLVNEAEDLVDALGQRLLALENQGVRRDELAETFRIVHTIKGLAVSASKMGVAEVAHRVETLLDRVHDDLELSPAALDLLYEAAELFARDLASSEDATSAARDAGEDLCARLESAAVSSPALVAHKRAALAEVDPELLNVLTRRERRHLAEAMHSGLPVVRIVLSWSPAALRTGVAKLKDALSAEGELIAFVPGPDAGAKIRLDAVVATAAEASTLDRIASDAGARPLSIVSAVIRSEEEDAVLVRSSSRSVRVDIRKIDGLLGAVGELSLLAAGVAAAADSLREVGKTEQAASLEADIVKLDERIAELQRGLIGVRMVALGPMLARLGRVARRVAQTTSKRVRFEVLGADTEVDKVIVEELAEPLLHLIRNAIDHGVEAPAERESLGKDVEGTITIRARQEGGQLVVDLTDDGQGIDRAAVLAAAVRRGLCSDETAAALNEREMLDLLFEPGFSTRQTADLVSGRGVGLDAVRARIGRLGGVIGLTSEVGKGACFSIRVPITLAVVHAILVRVGGQLFAMPVSGVVESARVGPGDIYGAAPHQRMTLRKQDLLLARVGELLSTPGQRPELETVVVGGVGSSRIGLLVDEVAGTQDVVVKPLPRCLDGVKGIAGAAELGGRQTILVLDVPALLELARHRQTAADAAPPISEPVPVIELEAEERIDV